MSKTVVYAEDMTDEMMNKAVAVAQEAFQLNIQSGKVYPSIAKYIRSAFDKEFGRNWNCVVGRSFGAYVTHEIKTYIYFSVVSGVSILLWKT
jgi:dynein light chain LC8-type